MHLSKSKYCTLWQCPKQLWLDAKHPELKVEDASREDRMTVGNEVGDLAMGLFGDFVETTVLTADGQPDIPAMLAKTQQCLADGTENICEAAFSYNGLYCAVDILRKEKGGYAIYEVKSSSRVKEIYGVDIAYQKYVLEHCGITVTGTYLVHMNANYVRGEELDIQGLFEVVDMTDWVALEYPQVAGRLAAAEKTMDSDTEPVQDIGKHCTSPYECPYWAYCSRNLPKPSVFDLYDLDKRVKFDYYRKGLVSFQDLLGAKGLGAMQVRQIRHQLNECGDEIDKAGVQAFLDTLSYPIYFFDFESMQHTIPLLPGAKPYAQIPFQYSLHYIETPGGEVKHKEFLAESGTDPRRAIAESICRDIPMHACVVVYYQVFERNRLEELAALFPDLSDHLLNIRSNVRDFLVPFKRGYYYNRAMGGSFSIKSVLPALFPGDPDLDYHNLDGIHNGSEAMTIFPKIKDMSPEDAAEARQNLLTYCKLDTYALVKVLQKLQEAAK